MLCPIGKNFGIFLPPACLSVDSTPIHRYRSGLKADSGPPSLILAGASLRACWLGDSVGLIEDNRGPDHHDDGIGPWLHLVFPELLDLAIN